MMEGWWVVGGGWWVDGQQPANNELPRRYNIIFFLCYDIIQFKSLRCDAIIY
jgi:hypothetical protein